MYRVRKKSGKKAATPTMGGHWQVEQAVGWELAGVGEKLAVLGGFQLLEPQMAGVQRHQGHKLE